MITDLLINEALTKYPLTKEYQDRSFELHCSPSFFKHLMEDLKKTGFQIPSEIKSSILNKEIDFDKITSIHIPQFGKFQITQDMEQGYWIGEKGEISDGSHTFDELYDHRTTIYIYNFLRR